MPHILDVIDVNFMQKIQDYFAEAFNLAMVSVYENDCLTQSSNPSDFCSKYIRYGKFGHKLCDQCHMEIEKKAMKMGEPIDYVCHAGLINFIVPIVLEGKYIASVLCGQILSGKPEEKFMRERARELGFDEEEYLAKIKEVKIISPEKLKTIKDLIYIFTNTITAISYANYQLAKMGLKYKIPHNEVFEKWLSSHPTKIYPRPVTNREFEVLKLVAQGKSNTEIAQDLVISIHTAKAHVSSLLEKMEVEDRVQLVVKAMKENLL